MVILTSVEEMRGWSGQQHKTGCRIGLVPTMGFLHEGHLSLIDQAKESSERIIVSIFVNPAQFDRKTDLDTYPVNLERDFELCRKRGVDAVYLPDRAAMYPEAYASWVEVERLGDFLCGAARPGHFRGVTTVVTKLFHAVQPDVAVFGRKDAQQAKIIQKMTDDLDFGVQIVLGDIVRENDGLALSSRNIRLTPAHRQEAASIHQGLLAGRRAWETGERNVCEIIDIAKAILAENAPTGRIDYLEVVDWTDLKPVKQIGGDVLLAAAVFFGDVRLIDNELLLMEER